MKHYASIPHYHQSPLINEPVIAFDKLDGSNLRFEWNSKRGFYKFGARQQTRTLIDPQFGKAFNHFVSKYQDGISAVMRSVKYQKIESIVCFGEMHGPNSEFGQHNENDEIDVTLFDVHLYKKGLVFPEAFVDDFGHLGIPNVIYRGRLSDSFIIQVKNNAFNLHEGVICKGVIHTKKKGVPLPEYCKIKTNDWIDRLRAKYGQQAVEKEFAGISIESI